MIVDKWHEYIVVPKLDTFNVSDEDFVRLDLTERLLIFIT